MKAPIHSVGDLFNRIRAVMLRDRCAEETAVAAVFAEIRGNPGELEHWFEALGAFWLQSTAQWVWNQGGPDKLGIRMGAPPAAAPPLPAPASPAVVQSWREQVDPLDLVIPINGRKKRLGSFSRADVLELASFYLAKGQKMIDEGKRWAGLAEVMTEGETLEVAMGRVEIEGELPGKLRGLSAASLAGGTGEAPGDHAADYAARNNPGE